MDFLSSFQDSIGVSSLRYILVYASCAIAGSFALCTIAVAFPTSRLVRKSFLGDLAGAIYDLITYDERFSHPVEDPFFRNWEPTQVQVSLEVNIGCVSALFLLLGIIVGGWEYVLVAIVSFLLTCVVTWCNRRTLRYIFSGEGSELVSLN
jgi:hypothetical protein